MNVLEYVIDFPKSYGEDRLAIGNDLVCAIDGSSPIKPIAVLPFHSQAEWLASAVAGAVSLCLQQMLYSLFVFIKFVKII